MAELRWDTHEVDRLVVDLTKAPARTMALAKRAIAKTAFDIERAAKLRTPVDTGFLRNSISTDISSTGLSAEIGPTANYGVFVEEGTSRMAPQPYLRPAFDSQIPGFVRAMESIGGSAL